MNFNRIGKLNDLLTYDLKRKPTIMLEPNPEHSYRVSGTANDIMLGIDTEEWEIPDELKPFVEELAKSDISNEEKILKIYQRLCEDYTYDDNVLSYIRKNDDESFFLPDEYGRKTNPEWKENRKKHNRRTCYEISRILAKSISEIFRLSGNSKNYDVCVIWDEANTHYFVGIDNNDYYVSLDIDDFTQIKDLTRLKTGMSLEGIKILEDSSGKFEETLKKFNNGKSKIAKHHIQKKLEQEHKEDIETSINSSEPDDLTFLKYTIQILKEEYNIDSAGIYEYLKEIIDTKMGAGFRKKVWKEVKTNSGTGKRYTRCLIVSIDDIPYMVDVTKNELNEIFHELDEREQFIPFKEMERDFDNDPYDGR